MHFASLKATLVELFQTQAWGHIEENDMTESVSMGTKRLVMFSMKKSRLHPNQPVH